MNHGYRRRRDTTTGIDNLFNKIIAENLPSLRNRRTSRCRKLTEYQTIRTKRETPPYRS
jgi:hypothetical protein